MLLKGEIILVPSLNGQEVFKITLWFSEGVRMRAEQFVGSLEECRNFIKEKCK